MGMSAKTQTVTAHMYEPCRIMLNAPEAKSKL
jgi:hypothetical protein